MQELHPSTKHHQQLQYSPVHNIKPFALGRWLILGIKQYFSKQVMNVNLTPQISFVTDDHGESPELRTAINHLDLTTPSSPTQHSTTQGTHPYYKQHTRKIEGFQKVPQGHG